ncbi:cysteine protease StiP family protein [Clostridium formicaceticum]|uniref:Cysteine protease StiP n=1 Tax=Clostridium formicaceticum TaxID=1497 RepID=A0AAC9RQ65_9CLOT|nr:cysteine protease StiP family protein [Clostridium formicaceticum]AOY74815.1 hypothetical protein BJL90_01885 [Clostridium formicaceticum]ARE89208.1 Cysteine protease StiP precursor [Clostridium formicaceticum]
MNEPASIGSYASKDVIFLLKDISHAVLEQDTRYREQQMQQGKHYSEMLPIEYKPSEAYMDLFHMSLNKSAKKLATAVGVVSEKVIKNKGKDVVLVSLARAGTPIGILIKRYILQKYAVDLPHYSISIIRGKGMDENALHYILRNHPSKKIQFVDGWTGKGAITKVLTESCNTFEKNYGIALDNDLAVLADPGYCVKTFGTREDFLIPSACLNATVSGLISRTVHRYDLIGDEDFHGVKYYKELRDEDVSNLFVDRISDEFSGAMMEIEKQIQHQLDYKVSWLGWKDIEKVQQQFRIESIHYIKPGIGETTRVLLRRMPWKVLVKKESDPALEHILLLAKEKNVPIEVFPSMHYKCCGLIQSLRGDQ